MNAQYLNGTHIGRIITFDHRFESGVKAVITGELRQVYHAAGMTVLDLAAPDGDYAGELEQFEIPPDRPVRLPEEAL